MNDPVDLGLYPRWIGTFLAYPWRKEPRWSECFERGSAMCAYVPARLSCSCLDPRETPISLAAMKVVLHQQPTFGWGRACVRVYLAEDDQETRGELALFALATALITRIAEIVHGKGWLDR